MRGSLMYNSSKAALAFSIRNMARELAPNTVVVGVAPCIIEDTPMTEYIDETVPVFRGWTPEKAREYERSNIPLGRRLTKDEVAQTMLFALNGPEALTGSILNITGGR
jgi:NAD(P)-dependent dehydrogenase (short-subunit alcohol dehydrogenase family)